MSLIQACFESLAAQNQTALIPFITAGDPQPDFTVSLMHQMVSAGANIIELGVPFSDPMADGPVIQAADERALAHHVSLQEVFDMVNEFRNQDKTTPVVLMGYLNPIEIMGYQHFANNAAVAGIDGVLVVDMPPEEAEDIFRLMKQQQIDLIFLVSPTTSQERIKLINQKASGYLYYVSLKGVTGANTLDVTSVTNKLTEIRQISDLPIGVGFGIKDGLTAQAVAAVADAVVVGSALVKRVEESQTDQALMNKNVSALVKEMRKMMDVELHVK